MSASISSKLFAEECECDGEYERREYEVLARLDLQGLLADCIVDVGDFERVLLDDAAGHGLSYISG